MGLLRNAYRRLVDHELGVLGGQLDRIESRLETLGVDTQALELKLNLAAKRLGMRVARATRGEAGGAADEWEDALERDGTRPRPGSSRWPMM